MNKDNAKDYLPLVQALSEGKVIQYKYQKSDKSYAWIDLESAVDFCMPADRYRIKPEPREISVNHYNEGLKLDHVCDSLQEAIRRSHEGYGYVTTRYREVIE